MSRRRPQSGFTLVEVLVTVIILAIGILGLAGLQIAGMRSNHSAFLRTQATLAASDLMDRMRVNPTDVVGEKLDSNSTTGVILFDRWAVEIAQWLPPPSGTSPQPRGTLDCGDNAICGNGNCAVIIRWDDARANPTNTWAARASAAKQTEFVFCSRLPEAS